MIVIVISAAVIILILVIAIAILLKSRKNNKFRSDIHISGGVDVDTGQMISDNNYFIGMGDDQRDTIVVGAKSQKSVYITLINMNSETRKEYNINLSNRIIIGRVYAKGILTIDNDSMISHQHCALYLNGGNVYIEDLHSANHTFLNDDIVMNPKICYDGDLIRIGQTNLMIQM